MSQEERHASADTQTQNDEMAALILNALKKSRHTKSELAYLLQVDPGQVTRWTNGKQRPNPTNARRLDTILGTNILDRIIGTDRISSDDPAVLFLSTPMAALSDEAYVAARRDLLDLAHYLTDTLSLYWAGTTIQDPAHFEASDVGTERNLRALRDCEAFVMVQLDDLHRTSSAYIELGLALGMRKPVTAFVHTDAYIPYMLQQFEPVVERLNFLERFRLYPIESTRDIKRLIASTGTELFGAGLVEASSHSTSSTEPE